MKKPILVLGLGAKSSEEDPEESESPKAKAKEALKAAIAQAVDDYIATCEGKSETTTEEEEDEVE